MDTSSLVLILGAVTFALGALEMIRSRGQAALAWAALAAGAALVLLGST